MLKNSEKLRPKIECEICGEKNSKILHRHHLVERIELNTNNSDWNLGILCPSCHSKVHSGSIRIIGVFPSTKPPTGKTLVYVKDGVCNIPSLEHAKPYYQPKPESMALFIKEENET
jgi:hypothetical protein